jgi:hypothetical protein
VSPDGRRRAAIAAVVLLGLLLGTIAAWMWPQAGTEARPTVLPPPAGPIGLALDPDAIPTEPAARKARLDELAAFLEGSAAVNLVCAVDPPVDNARALVVHEETGEPLGDGAIVNGKAYLVMQEAHGWGWFRVEGRVPQKFAWSGAEPGRAQGKCKPDPMPLYEGVAAVVGTVKDAEGNPVADASVEGCTGRAVTDADGAWYLEAKPGRCEIRAFKADGERVASSEPVEADPKTHTELVLDLVLKPWSPGGLGMQVADAEEGIEVLTLVPGGVADEAGLEPGDIVAAIDGMPTEGMTREEFVQLATGEGGTAYLVVTTEDGGQKKVEIDRRAIRGR